MKYYMQSSEKRISPKGLDYRTCPVGLEYEAGMGHEIYNFW